MKLQRTNRQVFGILTALGWVGGIAIGVFQISAWTQVQAQPPLGPVCIAVKPLEQSQQNKTCCQNLAKGTCLNLEEAFPSAKPPPNLSTHQHQLNATAHRFAVEALLYGQSTTGSGGSAKGAAIQMGVSKAFDALTQALPSLSTHLVLDHKTNFFQRLRRDYQQVFSTRPLGDRATLTPKLDVGFNVGDFNVTSMKAGVQIEF